MNSAICTLFEGHYHFGVAGLVNSLYHNGFRGDVYAGHKGELPSWASNLQINSTVNWPDTRTMHVAEGLRLHFLPLTTSYHLTNYKPDFMIELWSGLAAGADSMVYFDPDIVVVRPWVLIERWLQSGVALCEDVNSPLPENHPKRVAWRQYYKEKEFQLKFKEAFYANGGFVGVLANNREFLETWKIAQEQMAPAIGGLSVSAFPGEILSELDQSNFAPFGRTDQDALNVAIEISSLPMSFVGKEAMGFSPGEAILPHALGQPKPWQSNPLKQMVNGVIPRLVDKAYWEYLDGPIKIHSRSSLKIRNYQVKAAAFVSRFYGRR